MVHIGLLTGCVSESTRHFLLHLETAYIIITIAHLPASLRIGRVIYCTGQSWHTSFSYALSHDMP